MAEEANLRIDIQRVRGNARPIARVCLAFAQGYASDGAPALTRDCSTPAELEREVARLSEELSQALREGSGELSGAPVEPDVESEPAEIRDAEAPHLDSELRVEQLMTRDVRTIGRNEKVAIADELMRAGHFRHIVVVDEDESLAGVVSQRDIVFSVLGWQLGQGSNAHRRALESVLAKELMQTQIVTIAPEAPIGQAAQLMTKHKVGCLPVMDGSDLVGIITEGDFLSLVATG
jgi:CBS domain-containing membrane protein